MRESTGGPERISEESLRRLSPYALDNPQEIQRIFERVLVEGLELWRGTNRRAVPERAVLQRLEPDRLELTTENFGEVDDQQFFLNFSIDGARFFFSAALIHAGRREVSVRIPDVLYFADRRDRRRYCAPGAGARSSRLRLLLSDGRSIEGELVDSSPEGIGVRIRHAADIRPGLPVEIDLDQGLRPPLSANVRCAAERERHSGWRRLGLALEHPRRHRRLKVERPRTIELQLGTDAGLPPSRADYRFESRHVTYSNPEREEIRAIIDVSGASDGAPAVIIPPAWGRTKESTVALSQAILETFAKAGSPVSVVRFDGIRRRGQSFNGSDCVPPVSENLRYTFSQGVRDIETTRDFLSESSDYRPRTIILVTFSIAAVEGRRAIAADAGRKIDGWISVVGASDPQSMIRVVSGGIDYFAGAEHGLKFGVQYIQGLLLDVDGATRDAREHRLGFLEDARRDLASIDVPITWFYGRDDAWTDLDRVRDILSVGDVSRRKLIEVPMGHQMQTSREAMETLAMVAAETARLALGRAVQSVVPDRSVVRGRRRRERVRLAPVKLDLRSFWKDYLVGRDGRVGIEFISSTTEYRELMDVQIRALDLSEGAVVVDLGSGAGSLPVELSRTSPKGLRIVEVDLVPEALQRSRRRVAQVAPSSFRCVEHVAANLDLGRDVAAIPIRSATADAVIASLVVNYLSDPAALLLEIARVLRPGGRLVISGMRPDTDVSNICVRGVGEIRAGDVPFVWSADGLEAVDQPLQEFISNGARLLDLEEQGVFRFLAADEMETLISGPHFDVKEIIEAYGDPPQAFVVVAERSAELVV